MAHRLLVIENPSIPTQTGLGRMLASEASFRCEHANWDSFVPDSLRHCTAHLIVAVAVPQPAKAVSLFRWLHDHTVSASIFAVLPSQPENQLFRSAMDAVDDFLLCPIREEELRHRLSRILGSHADDLETIRNRLTEEFGLSQLIGLDPDFLREIGRIPLLAHTDAPVLITGETGTGKELCARIIHHISKRRSSPFIPVDCGAVPDHLFENELFGHARGAFTDAHTDQKGLAALAEGGTLFLDEIDSLSPRAQVKLLRFLEERTYKPLGAERFARADINIIAASNCNLESCMRESCFRPDLYYRLNVLRLHLPPLRERRGDIPLLARYFLESLGPPASTARKVLTPAALHKLVLHDWPGNARELYNIVQRAALFSTGQTILPRDIQLPPETESAPTLQQSFRQVRARAIGEFEQIYIAEMLRKHHGNITRAAQEAKKDRRAFGRLVKKHNIDRRAF